MKLVRIAVAVTIVAVGAWAAIALSRVDADIGAPAGPDRLVRTLDGGAGAAIDARSRTETARDILRQRPVDGRAFRLLAQAELARSEPDATRADGFLAIAIRRAPRDRPARAAAIDRAFARGDVAAGMEHLDALLRVAPGVRAEMLQRLALLLEHDGIRAALLARLGQQPNWHGSLVAALKSPQVPAAPAAHLLESLAQQRPLEAGEVDALITLLTRLGRHAEARAAWLQSLPAEARGNRADSGLFDGGFEHPAISGGYGWRIAPQPGVSVAYDDVEPFEGAHALALAFAGRAVANLGIEQVLALPPGRYRLDLAVENATEAARPFVIEVGCQGGGPALLALELPAAGRTPAWQRSGGGFVVPEGACAGQVLRLRYPGRSLAEQLVAGTLRLDAMHLTPERNARLQ
ncbi:hypothetical protein ACFPOA_06745 [Lysobacter niabensis]|uniref:hypothetical protein n=1 Tax=Agrilutibacter niabensis TaxID=380628 RepID=UPI00361A581C